MSFPNCPRLPDRILPARRREFRHAEMRTDRVGGNTVIDRYSVEQGLQAWETNAQFWDEQMGEHSNQFHREVARPKVSRLLEPKKGDFILDACGNGNYSAYMAQAGARVVAFDYSPKMIALAKQRQQRFLDQIEFFVADATKKNSSCRSDGDGPIPRRFPIWRLWILPM